MSKLIPLTAVVLLFFTGHVTSQDATDAAAKRVAKADKGSPKRTEALRAIAVAEKAIKADESLNEKQKSRAIRGLNAVRRTLGVKPKGQTNKKKRGKKGDGNDADADGKDKAEGAKKRKGRKKRDGAGQGDGARKKRGKKKNKFDGGL